MSQCGERRSQSAEAGKVCPESQEKVIWLVVIIIWLVVIIIWLVVIIIIIWLVDIIIWLVGIIIWLVVIIIWLVVIIIWLVAVSSFSCGDSSSSCRSLKQHSGENQSQCQHQEPEMDCLNKLVSALSKLLVHNKAQRGSLEEGNENLDGVQSVLSKARRKEWSIALSDSFFGKKSKVVSVFLF